MDASRLRLRNRRARLATLLGGAGARERAAALLVAATAAVVTYLVATTVFPYHSSNHDEAVYLQQASMLLSGQLELYAGDLAGAFRPWFFVEDGSRLYPKYQPYPAALYAVALGEPRAALAATAGLNAALVYVLGSMAFDRRVGVVASVVFAASPLALVTSAAFLPYAPTTTLNLLFAVLYLRGVRTGGLASAAGAGLAIGLAFFARPYTAVLFAAPFVAHALLDVGRALRSRRPRPPSSALLRNAVTATGGLAFVGLALAYNARMTGSPLVFSYEAFAPLDGPGFGYRQILGHGIEYTPELAVEANGYVLWYLATRWFTAGALGTAAAAVGLGVVARRWWRLRDIGGEDPNPPFDRATVATLAGLFVSVPLGNVAFWGNVNVLATKSDPTDGLISQFGPIYHFDLLVPLSVFAAVGVVACWRWLRSRAHAHASPGDTPMTRRHARIALAVVILVALPVVAGANAAVVTEPLDRNAAYTDKYEAAYEPFEERVLEDALVFLPTPYGDWQNHPFQYLRNEPGFDGPVVYALERSPAEDFAVLDAYPDRRAYRYTYRGEWTPVADRHVTPKLEPLDVRTGERLAGETVVGVPDRVERARVRLAVDGDHHEYAVERPADRLAVEWELDEEGARLSRADGEALELEGAETVVLTVTLVQPDGGTLTYRQETAVRTTADGERFEAVWPPERTVCPLVADCGREGTYLPDRPEEHREWVVFETRLTGL